MNSTLPYVTNFGFEKQFQSTYTNDLFIELRDEITSIMYCEVTLNQAKQPIMRYDVKERVSFNGSRRRYEFEVKYNVNNGDIYYNYRLFEFKGILCRHVFRILILLDIDVVPTKYICQHWRKDIRRNHSKVAISNNWPGLTKEMK